MTAVPPLRTLLRPLRVAVLNSPGSGSFSYAPLLGDLLRSAVSTPSLVEVTAFDTEARSLPPLSFDGYVLSGSRHGVYDRATLPWVEDLVQWSKARGTKAASGGRL